MKAMVFVAFLASACTTAELQDAQPAVLLAPTTATRAELHKIITAALGNRQLMLADDALTHESTLILDRQPRTDAGGALLNGRELGMPEHFALFVRGSNCWLVRERTGQRWQLAHAQCKPVAPGVP